uniref:Thermostable carboxypeptidase 2 n=1 Tax=Lygus hesperus TaxID=30085 RepID=A0A0A9YMZ1_LYGHE
MEGVKYIYGHHLMPSFKTGELGVKNGVLTSASDSFNAVIKGKGGHASTPHLLLDPVPIAAEVVMAIQTIVSRKVDPQQPVVISIPTMTTGPNESNNVIPNEVKLMGTIRTFDNVVRK